MLAARFLTEAEAIVLRATRAPDDPNWIEHPAIMNPVRRRLLSEKAAELHKSHPLIDWSESDGTPGLRRVAIWTPEL